MTIHNYADVLHLKESSRYMRQIVKIDIAPELKDFAMITQDSTWVMRKKDDEDGYYLLLPMSFADRKVSTEEHIELVKKCFAKDDVPGEYIDGAYDSATASVLALVRCTSLDDAKKLVTTPFWN